MKKTENKKHYNLTLTPKNVTKAKKYLAKKKKLKIKSKEKIKASEFTVSGNIDLYLENLGKLLNEEK